MKKSFVNVSCYKYLLVLGLFMVKGSEGEIQHSLFIFCAK